MLSIGKHSAGQAPYYLDQAEGRVDVVESVGDGVEDYYLGGGEARGSWMGIGARELGLGGTVGGDELRRMLAGLDPWSGRPLRSSASPVRVAGFDLTFSVPKSVSVLFGIGDPRVRDAVRSAHQRSVEEAMGYVERSAALVRRGHGGVRLERAGGLVAATFRHRTSRAGDPQLHTHVLVANLGRGPDGRWSALDARQVYAHARVASFVYQAVLRGELTARLGVEWTPVRQGIAEVAGVPAGVMREFSRRRAEIVAALEQRGTSGPRAAEAAALATRRAKDPRVQAERLRLDWRRRAAERGLGSDGVEALLGRGVPPVFDASIQSAIEDALAAPDGLTLRRASFSRRDVLLQTCERLPPGVKVSARELEAAVDRFLASERVVPLLGASDAEAFRGRDGRHVPVPGEERRYSTPDLLALEQRVVDHVVRGRGIRVAVAGGQAVAAATGVRPSLSDEQRVMVQRLCLDGDAVAVVAGKAGTGKTFALAAAREAWAAAGYPVLGAAVARRAARELETGAGIRSTSVTVVLASTWLPERVVLVVDEAGMVGTRQLAALADRVDQARGKLVLVGDHRQLPELEAGGAFRGLVRRGLAIELRENRRQTNEWERGALDHVREGRAEEAVEVYAAHGRLNVAASAEEARVRLVRDWAAHGDPDGSVMIARRRVDVADLNRRARERMREAGSLGAEELRLAGGSFAVGDCVVVKQNAPRVGVSNGDRAVVTAVDVVGARLELDRGGQRIGLGPGFLGGRTAQGEPTLLHGYAITGHVAQGLTVDRAFVLADEGLDREWAYVALSRGREANHLYVGDRGASEREEYAPADPAPPDPRARLAAQLGTSRAEDLAIDIGPGRVAAMDELMRVREEAREACVATRMKRYDLERGWRRWLPAGRRELEAARLAERFAEERLERLPRELPRPPVKPTRGVELPARRQERDRGRDFGIEL
jgi:conjugative relaxase-like TrwC/TraI family protein